MKAIREKEKESWDISRWITATLVNDENSTDDQLYVYFRSNGAPEKTAKRAIRARGRALKDPFGFAFKA